MHPTLSKAIMLTLILASPWLLVQAWILAAAQDETISDMESCPDGSANCAHLGGDANYRMDASSTTLERSMEDVRIEILDYILEYDCNILEEHCRSQRHLDRDPFVRDILQALHHD